MPTVEEIAKLAGVSRSTVSRVINDDPKVKAETRERVLNVVRKLDFRPSTAARRLAGGRSGIFGLVIPMGVARLFTDPYFPILLQSVSATCNARGHTVMLWLAEPEHERRLIGQLLNDNLLDGVIVSSMSVDDPIVDALARSNLPFMLIGRHPTDPNPSYVDVDNQAGARRAVLHLLSRGRRRVGAISGPQNMIVSLDRLEGYKQALRASGFELDPALILDGNFTEDGGYRCAHLLLEQGVDAIFACSDFMALGVLRALHEKGVRIPDDVAVAGFDDAPFAAKTTPPLTTIRQPTDQLGSHAVEMLIDLIEGGEEEPLRKILPAELVIRESS